MTFRILRSGRYLATRMAYGLWTVIKDETNPVVIQCTPDFSLCEKTYHIDSSVIEEVR